MAQSDAFKIIDLESKDDSINHPSHYTQGAIEVIDFLEDQPATRCDPLLWQVIRYVCRSPFKVNQIEDLKKARWYLNRRILQLEKDTTSTGQRG